MLKRISVSLGGALLAALICHAPVAQATKAAGAAEAPPSMLAAASAFYDLPNCNTFIFSMDPWVNWSWLWPEQNDRVSSIAVGGRTRIVIYEHINYGGASWPVNNWNSGAVCVNVPAWIDNKTSSIQTSGI